MANADLQDCLRDLEQSGQLLRVEQEIDPYLELAALQRRVTAMAGPALLFTRVKGCRFPVLANLYGNAGRIHHIFRHGLRQVEALLKLSSDPADFFRHPGLWPRAAAALCHALPRRALQSPVLEQSCTLADLPHIVSWPQDGGAFITLPQVWSENPARPGLFASNLGMYRVQISGNSYADNEAGMHYQTLRGLGFHHAEALRGGERLRVRVFVGGPPAMTLAAIMPLPENLPEVCFAGMLGGRGVSMSKYQGEYISARADFCLVGSLGSEVKPEGPFGDHLGYYSLTHDFPLMRVEEVRHRADAVWPFTSVGRPPQEDTRFGALIHELTGPLLGRVFPGVCEVNAVDAAGVHPLLLAVASERYVPFGQAEASPRELQACGLALMGQSQTSLSKYFLLAAREDGCPSAREIPAFFRHMLERTDFARDLHFIGETNMDTLDYSGGALNRGSKLLWAAAGQARRTLSDELPQLEQLGKTRLLAPGITVLQGPEHGAAPAFAESVARALQGHKHGQALLVLVDDADFAAANWDNFLWTTFTRSDPAADIHGINAVIHNKHWRCDAPLIIDARTKAHHAPALVCPPEVEKRVDELLNELHLG